MSSTPTIPPAPDTIPCPPPEDMRADVAWDDAPFDLAYLEGARVEMYLGEVPLEDERLDE